MKKERIAWIDVMRGFCMLMILWFHTEMYYAGHDIVPYDVYVVDALAAFFFLSGYVFCMHDTFSLHRKLYTIVRSLVLPYFFFTVLLALPKSWVNHTSLTDVLTHIVLGNGSWFVASLITAEVLFALSLSVRYRWFYHVVPIVALIGAVLLTDTNLSLHHNYWNYHNAFIGLLFIYAGYICQHYGDEFMSLLSRTTTIIVLAILILLIKTYVLYSRTSLLIEPVGIDNYAVFLADTLIFIAFFAGLCQRLPANRFSWVSWTGRHTLVIYFFCGVVPMAMSLVLQHAGLPYNGQYLRVVPLFFIVWATTAILAWLFYRYLPFIVNHRKS